MLHTTSYSSVPLNMRLTILFPTMLTLDLCGRTTLCNSRSNSLGMMAMGGLLDLPSIGIQPLKSTRMWEISATMGISHYPRSLSTRMSTVNRYLKERWLRPKRNGIPREMSDPSEDMTLPYVACGSWVVTILSALLFSLFDVYLGWEDFYTHVCAILLY